MRTILEITRFEIGYQLRSPFFLGALLIFALIHFLSITGTGINLDFGNQLALNGIYVLLQTELLLFIFGMLPILAFVTTAITRDFEHATAPLVYAAPIPPKSFVLGRFFGALFLSILISLAGLLGTMIGTFMPWLDQARIIPFSPLPWAYIFFVILLPNTAVLCAIFFSVAALTRSFAVTYGAAMAFFVADLFLNGYARLETGTWASLADPVARLTVAAETRFWTPTELNASLPIGLLPQNRLLWLIAAMLILLLTTLRFNLALKDGVPLYFKRRTHGSATPHRVHVPAIQPIIPISGFSAQGPFRKFISQTKMDLSCVFKNPLIYIILVLQIAMLISEFRGNVQHFFIDYPLYPLTSLMLPFLGESIQFILLVGLWYSAELIHRERTSGVFEIVSASPCPDWLMLLSKIGATCIVVHALMLTAVLTLVVLQASAGYTHFELGLYFQSAFIYSGIYFCMLCTLAVVIQAISANRWVGMLLTLCTYIALLSLAPLGFDHILCNFTIPVIYSDMNGFGHFAKPAFMRIGYLGAFCVLCVVAGHLLYPCSSYSTIRERLHDAKSRVRSGVCLLAGFAAAAFIALGGWIFYNTDILNEYKTPNQQLRYRADYEKEYGRYENLPAPSFDSIDMAIDIFPEERRLESRGSAMLGNHKKTPINEFVLSIDPGLRVNQIQLADASMVRSDKAQGFYLYRLNTALPPGSSIKLTWNVSRRNDGFTANPDNEIVANGTYVSGFRAMPIPGYDNFRKMTDNAQRRKYGLPPTPRVPRLGDPAHSDSLAMGIDSRSAFQIVLSTSGDQIAVAPGALLREWYQGGRHYFHYRAEQPILPNLSFCSARYRIARDKWKDVLLEIYYDPKHPFNIPAMMETAKRALEYYSREFAPYQYSYLRILEYARYRTAAQFQPGIIPYSEAIGFVTNLRAVQNADSGVMHELAHMWWADRISGAQIQGRWMLTESMAEYCRLMLFKEYYSPIYANQIARGLHNGYLNGRKAEDEAEVPAMYTENHAYLRGKGPLVMYALQDILGKEKLHHALRRFLQDYSFRTSPPPTSRDVVNALRDEAGPEYQQLITDLFERIVLYDLQADAAEARKISDGFETTIEITARQFEADAHGKETEESLDTWFDVALFPETDEPLEGVAPLSISKHLLHSGKQTLTIRTLSKPGIVALDPFHKMIDRRPENNSHVVALRSNTLSR